MSSSAKRIVPASGRRLPASWPMRVVLPAPFGPMIACVSPWRTSSVTWSVASSAPNDLHSPSTWSNASLIAAASRQEARQSAPGEEHHQHEDRAEDDLPVGGPRREQVLEQKQGGRAEHRPDQRRHAAED